MDELNKTPFIEDANKALHNIARLLRKDNEFGPPENPVAETAAPPKSIPEGGIQITAQSGHRLGMMDHDPTPMGGASNPLFSPKAVFARTFRFLAEPRSHPDICYAVKRCGVNYYDETIDLEIYESPGLGDTHGYLMHLADTQNKHELRLTTLDGCGTKLYMMVFHDLQPLDHYVDFDYAKSDIVTHKLKLGYGKMERIDLKQC